MSHARSALEDLLRAAREERPFDASAFTDEALFRLEKSKIFDASSFAIAGLADARYPGEWTRVPEVDPRMVFTCAADLERHAIFDVCRHRGARLLPEAPSGREPALCIECPYHRWRYALDGARLDARGPSDALVRAQCDRRAAQFWARYESAVHPVFSLPEWLTDLDRAPLVCARSTRWEVRANWKLVVENFVEAHHFECIHPALERWTPWRQSSSTMDPWWIAGEMPLVDDAETVSESGLTRGRAFIVGDERERRRVRDAWVFPNALYSRQPDYLLAYRLFATALDRTVLRCDTLVHQASPEAHIDEVTRFWDGVHDEDRLVCESQQASAASRGWSLRAYESSEDGVRAFDQAIARVLAPHG